MSVPIALMASLALASTGTVPEPVGIRLLLANGLVTALVVAAVNAAFKWWEPYNALEAKRRDELRREQADVESGHLRPLHRAAKDLLTRLTWINAALQEGVPDKDRKRVDHLVRSVGRVKDANRDLPVEILLFANGEGVDGCDILHATASYFAASDKARTALPSIERVMDRSFGDLDWALSRVELGFNKDGHGIYETTQRSVGQHMIDAGTGMARGYARFCEELAMRPAYAHYLTVMDFYRDIGGKRDHQLLAALKGLEQVVAVLDAGYAAGRPRLGRSKARRA